MRIREEAHDGEEGVNLMPLIDMVFLLLIFFLVATTLAQEEREITVQLPGTSSHVPLSAPPPQLIINIEANGQVVIAREKYTWKQLADLLAEVAEKEPHRQILIRADKNSRHVYFAAAARFCRQVGISETRIGLVLEEIGPADLE